jgi:hypothetical protein
MRQSIRLSTKLSAKFLFLIILVFCSMNLYAQSDSIQSKQLESSVNQKVSNSLDLFLTKKQYLINTKIAFKKSSKKAARNAANVQLTDSDKSQDDYILFHKLGLEVNSLEQVEDSSSKKDLGPTLSSVTIEILIDKNIAKELKTNISSIVKKISFNLSVKPRIKISDLIVTPKAVEEKSLIEQLSPFSTALSFIVSSIIFCFFALIIFFLYSKLSKNQTQELISSNKEISDSQIQSTQAISSGSLSDGSSESIDSAVSNAAATGEIESSGSTESINLEDTINSTTKRFSSFYEENKLMAVSSLKSWINQQPRNFDQALIFLAQQLDSDLLMGLFSHLSFDDRKIWKNTINQQKSILNIPAACQFINNEILENIILPSDLISEETKNLLYTLEPESCVEMLEQKPELGPLLFNTLSTDFIIKLIPKLSTELTEQFTTQSVSANPEELKQQDKVLQEELAKFTVKAATTPFGDKITQILPHVGLSEEKFFIEAYAQSKNKEGIKSLLKAFTPMNLIEKLSEQNLRLLYQGVPQSVFVDKVAIADESQRPQILDIFAPQGNKKREMIDLELENIVKNDIQLAKMNKNKDAIEKKFVDSIRKVIRSRESIQIDLEDLINQQTQEYLGGSESETQSAA